MVVVSKFYDSCVWQIRKPLTNNQSQFPENAVIPIKFQLYISFANTWDSEDDINFARIEEFRPVKRGEEITISEFSHSKLLSDRSASSVCMSRVLSRMGIPENEQAVIIGKIFPVLEWVNAIVHIRVAIRRVTMVLQSIEDRSDHVIDRVTRESMATYEARPIPAAKWFIDQLRRQRLDDNMEEEQSSCVICMESFERGARFVRLPCSHFFHDNCTVKWLRTSHSCPLCRHQMPALR